MRVFIGTVKGKGTKKDPSQIDCMEIDMVTGDCISVAHIDFRPFSTPGIAAEILKHLHDNGIVSDETFHKHDGYYRVDNPEVKIHTI